MLRNIYLFTTNRCDLHCQHCLQVPEKYSNFPVEQLDKLLSEALTFGAKNVGLTGGEPFIHPEFPRIVETVVSYGYSWGFVTHGQQSEPYLPLMERFRNHFKSVHLSIDSTISDLHDEIRMRKGAFEKAIGSVNTYVQHDFPVWINTTLNQRNKAEVVAFIDLATKLGAIGIQFAGTIPTEWNQHLVLSDYESLGLYQEIISLQRSAKIKIDTTSALFTHGGVYYCGLLSFLGLSVNSNGELTFCCDTHQGNSMIGSLREHSLSELLQAWIDYSAKIQQQRAEQIVKGSMEDLFDTCAFCNRFFVKKM
jgi:MoaA/NifB/PqqE/SkfB family radical SAM enzyme